MTSITKSYAAASKSAELKPFDITRRELGENDIMIDITHCGICHSDLHFVENDWGKSIYPVVPGHEIVGKITNIGRKVTDFKIGDTVGVGCMVDSCRTCSPCKQGHEQYCEAGMTMTYNSEDKISGGVTYGGYSENIVVDKDFVLKISDKLDLKSVAPLLCAGITTYSPLKQWNIKPGDRVGVVGLGGLGHMGIKFANAMGAHVVMITTSESKAEDAKMLGAHEVLISTNPEQMQNNFSKFDFILNTIPVAHDVNPYLDLLKLDKTMVLVGAINPLPEVDGARLIFKRRNLAGSLIGGIQETQEMLDFCAKHNIVADIELINIQNINKAYKRMQKSDVKYRFVIDMDSLKNS